MTAETNASVTGHFGLPVILVRGAIENFGDMETILTKVNH